MCERSIPHLLESHQYYFLSVSTSSPFGLRCSSIHDPSAAGSNPSWLPHSDIPVTNLETDLNVDKAHHQRLASLSQANPLVQNLIWSHRPSLKKRAKCIVPTNGSEQDVEWRDTYSLVCNLANLKTTVKKHAKENATPTVKISELQRLCIAVHMGYGNKHTTDYVYKHEHLAYNELCMVVSAM